MSRQVVAAGAVGGHWALAGWRAEARCARHGDPDALFADSRTQRREAARCRSSCPVRAECLAWALDTRFPFGVMGGMTERERRALLKRRPNVVSWRALLEAAREQWQREQDLTATLAHVAGGAR